MLLLRCLRPASNKLLFFTMLCSVGVHSAPSYNLNQYPDIITMTGNSSGGTVRAASKALNPEYMTSYGTDYLWIVAQFSNGTSGWAIWTSPGALLETCPSGVTVPVPISTSLSADSRAAFIAWVDARMSRGVTLVPVGDATRIIDYQDNSGSVRKMSCRISGSDPEVQATISWYSGQFGGTPPNAIIPVCTLSSSDLSFDFKAETVDVTGISQGKYVPINCTSGTRAANYRIRLTSGSASNGNITFGNNVSVSFKWGSTALPVNGSGISMSLSSTTTQLLNATLSGTATSEGKSYASGVLILEAL